MCSNSLIVGYAYGVYCTVYNVSTYPLNIYLLMTVKYLTLFNE